MPFTGRIGDTLLLADIGGGHRYVILTKPNDNRRVVITNFSTAKHLDWQVVFRPKDDRQLFTERCTPNYHDAQLYPLNKLLKLAQRPHAAYQFCASNHIKRIVSGALQSNHTPLEILKELAAQYPEQAKNCYKLSDEINPKPLDNA
jgi:hypothetical protein